VKKFIGTFAALGIALILGAYIIFTQPEKSKTGISESSIFQVTPDAVHEISITRDKATVIVKKDDDGAWVMESPGAYETSQEAMNSLVERIAEAEFDKEIEVNPSDLEVFGLNSPNTRIEVKGHKGKKKTLLIGSATPVGSGYYGKSTDDTTVYVIPTLLADSLSKTADDLRERKIVKASSESVNGIRIIRRTENDVTDVICEKRSDAWYITHPITDKADKFRLDELIWDITGLTAEGFVDDEGSDLPCWGLDRPRVRIDLTMAERGTPLQVLVGDLGPDEEGFYVKTGDSPAVYLVKPWAFSPLELTPPDLVDSQLAQWDDDEVITVTWVIDDKPFSLLRDGKGWKSISASPLAPLPGRPAVIKEEEGFRITGDSKFFTSSEVDPLRTALQDIRIIGVGEILKPDTDRSVYGLDNPAVWVQLDLGDGNIFEVKVGKEIEEGFYAIATGRDFVYLVAKDGIEALDEALRELSP